VFPLSLGLLLAALIVMVGGRFRVSEQVTSGGTR